MSTPGISDTGVAATQRLVRDIWDAARDPKLARDAAAQARWQVYAQRQIARLVEEECARRQGAPGP